jgi:hypothetical protein
MPAQDEKLRRAVRDAARRSRDWGSAASPGRFPVRALGSDEGMLRENGRFFDQTDKPVIGFVNIGSFTT